MANVTSFEIVADKDQLITFYVTVPHYLRTYFEQQFQAQYDAAVIDEVDDYNVFEPNGVVVASRISLKKPQEFPLLVYNKLEIDPLNALTNVLSKFEKHEGAAVQMVIRPARSHWARKPAHIAAVMHQGKKYEQAHAEVAGWFLYREWIAFKYIFFKDRANVNKVLISHWTGVPVIADGRKRWWRVWRRRAILGSTSTFRWLFSATKSSQYKAYYLGVPLRNILAHCM